MPRAAGDSAFAAQGA